MKVDISQNVLVNGKSVPVNAGTHQVNDQVVCTCGDARVEVRNTADGMVVVIANATVSLEPRAAGIWINVEEA